MSQILEGKFVVVTGGSSGIGRVVGQRCAEEGATVAVIARSESAIDETIKSLTTKHQQKHLGLVCDVTKLSEIKNTFGEIKKRLPRIDGLICAAGIHGLMGAFADTPFETWADAIHVNLLGTAACVHTALPQMPTHSGVILFSGAGQGAMPNFSAYASSKGGIWRLTETLGEELASRKIFVNAIAPGAVNSGMLDNILQSGPEKAGTALYEKSLRQQSTGGEDPRLSADLCLYLLSENARGLYGKILSPARDAYRNFTNLEQLSQSDIFKMRRVVAPEDKWSNTTT